MTKLRKQRKKKTFRYNVNRKRVNKKRAGPKIKCDEVRNAWQDGKSLLQNWSEMGLACDPNKAVDTPKQWRDVDVFKKRPKEVKPVKGEVAAELEAQARVPRIRKFTLPPNLVSGITAFLDKHGYDFKAMQRDTRLNPWQETWRQIRSKVKQLQRIKPQWEAYLAQRDPSLPPLGPLPP